MTTPHEDLLVLDAEPGVFTFFAWQNVMIIVWSGASSLAYLKRLTDVTAATRERFPHGGASVYLIRPSSSLPDAATRAALLRLEQQYSDWLSGIAIVIGGVGFWTSTMRSVVTAMRVATRRPYEMRSFASSDEVATWLPPLHLKKTGVPLDPAQLLAALRKADAQEAATGVAAHPA